MSHPVNDQIYEEYRLALIDLANTNDRMLYTLRKVLELANSQAENNAKILQTSYELTKTIDNILYYEQHGSLTLPKNSRIDVTTDFNK